MSTTMNSEPIITTGSDKEKNSTPLPFTFVFASFISEPTLFTITAIPTSGFAYVE